MPYRVKNTKTGHVYTSGMLHEDETDITSDLTPALEVDGQNFRPPAYGDEAKAELSASSKASKKGN